MRKFPKIPFEIASRERLRCHNVVASFCFSIAIAGWSVVGVSQDDPGQDKVLRSALKAIAATDGSVEADSKAAAAIKQLQGLPSERVIEVLGGFSSSTVRGKNWLRSLAADISDNGDLPVDELLQFFRERANDSDARYVAYQLLTQSDPSVEASLLEGAESDPSLPVRFLKIKTLIERASEEKESSPSEAIATLKTVVSNGRSPSQLETASKLLEELGEKVDLADELGMVRTWWVIGPFDNTDSKHFSTAYLPENRYLESGSPVEEGSDGKPKTEIGKDKREISWQRVESEDSLGMVDLNAPLANEKDAVAYVFARFKVTEGPFDQDAQIRIGCITANKVWVNGKLVSSNDVYHSGTRIDQYVDACQLVEGENTVMIKVLQNAQTQPWAQDWQFQFRFTRGDGSAVKTEVLP